MICELYLKNCALVEEVKVDFGKKLNILSGETGSGKSIILEGINLCLGGKYDRSFLRKGSEYGLVELTVDTKNEKFLKVLNDLDIEYRNDEYVIISRKLLKDGKTNTKVNGKNIRVGDLKILMSCIIDMHGQHQNQALYNKDNHIEFVDLYGKEKILPYINCYTEKYNEYLDIKRKIFKTNDNKSEMEIQREKDLLKFQINEISAAKLVVGELEELKRKRDIISNSEKIFSTLSESYSLLRGNEINSEDNIGKSVSLISNITKYDTRIEEIYSELEKVLYEIQDLSSSIRDYLDGIEFDPALLNEIEERIDVINSLRRKYGDTVEDILKYLEDITERLYIIDNREEEIKRLNEKLLIKSKELDISANELTEVRKDVSFELERELLDELSSLNMKNTRFKVNFNKIDYNENGNDDVEFHVSFNLGEDLNPLNKVASGGEMSRFMLAFKSILANVDSIESLIFDEIDTGISGRAAQIVGEKLSLISRSKQIICITHLPQIASFADNHYLIEKHVENERTHTSINLLDEKSKIDEISRLIAGKIITDKTIEHANEILNIANSIKDTFTN